MQVVETVGVKELGLRLHVLRFMRDERLADVSAATGIPKSTLARWERPRPNAKSPASGELSRLANYYGIGLQDLLDPDQTLRVWFNAARPRAA